MKNLINKHTAWIILLASVTLFAAAGCLETDNNGNGDSGTGDEGGTTDNKPNDNVFIILDKDTLTLEVGKTEILFATVSPLDEVNNIVLHWKSSDETKAKVDENGEVTGIAAGTVKITVTAGNTNRIAECLVTVNSVYITGTFIDSNTRQLHACFWKDGTRIELPSGINASLANGIAISNGKIYVSGSYSDITSANGSTNKACYWVNGSRIDLPDENGNSLATGITIFENEIYIAGWYNDGNFSRACYWVNGAKIDLPIGYGNSFASDIVIFDGKVIIAGCYGKINALGHIFEPNDEVIYCYWINGKKFDLPGRTHNYEAPKIAVSEEGKIYITGYFYEQLPSGVFRLISVGYWIDGERIDIINATSLGGIIVYKNKVYVAGSFLLTYEGGSMQQACYWIDNVRIDLLSDTDSYATAISVSGDKIFIAGKYSGGICYWVDGERKNLPDGWQSKRIVIANE